MKTYKLYRQNLYLNPKDVVSMWLQNARLNFLISCGDHIILTCKDNEEALEKFKEMSVDIDKEKNVSPYPSLIPNVTTSKAMKEVDNGEYTESESVDALMKELNCLDAPFKDELCQKRTHGFTLRMTEDDKKAIVTLKTLVQKEIPGKRITQSRILRSVLYLEGKAAMKALAKAIHKCG